MPLLVQQAHELVGANSKSLKRMVQCRPMQCVAGMRFVEHNQTGTPGFIQKNPA
jgi:hypothetical protein